MNGRRRSSEDSTPRRVACSSSDNEYSGIKTIRGVQIVCVTAGDACVRVVVVAVVVVVSTRRGRLLCTSDV